MIAYSLNTVERVSRSVVATAAGVVGTMAVMGMAAALAAPRWRSLRWFG